MRSSTFQQPHFSSCSRIEDFLEFSHRCKSKLRRPFPVEANTKRCGCEVVFASKRNRELFRLFRFKSWVPAYFFVICVSAPEKSAYSDEVCSIFLRVDRSINEIHKPRTILSIPVFNKKYVFIVTDIFYVHCFFIKLASSFKNTYF